ncbi:MAG TPA: zinc-binding dehydrogenase, partial [Ignavibacteriaceae bacterium]|nr:zinc-binding dehydrogenase [Ignavibacteriaceae bacterium]
PNSKDLLNQVAGLTSGGPDVIIECAGNSSAANLAIELSKKGGRVIIFGLAAKSESINLNLQEIFLKELTIKSSLLNPFTFSRAVNLLINKKVHVEKLNPVITNLSDLEKILSQPRNSTVIKYQITPN